jgi:hypothetical protein
MIFEVGTSESNLVLFWDARELNVVGHG